MINEQEIMKYFSDYATRCMNELDLRPWYVAYYSETDEGTFRKYMKCIRLPRITTLIMTSELFNCSVNELLGYERVPLPVRKRAFNSGLDTKRLLDHFYSEVARRMVRARLSLDEMATYLSVSAQTLENYFWHDSLPDTSVVLHICDALNCTPSELLGY